MAIIHDFPYYVKIRLAGDGKSNPELACGEFEKNISRAERPRLASEDDILSMQCERPTIFTKGKGVLKALLSFGGDDGNRTHVRKPRLTTFSVVSLLFGIPRQRREQTRSASGEPFFA